MKRTAKQEQRRMKKETKIVWHFVRKVLPTDLITVTMHSVFSIWHSVYTFIIYKNYLKFKKRPKVLVFGPRQQNGTNSWSSSPTLCEPTILMFKSRWWTFSLHIANSNQILITILDQMNSLFFLSFLFSLDSQKPPFSFPQV